MMAANYLSGITVTLQSENGILGLVSLENAELTRYIRNCM